MAPHADSTSQEVSAPGINELKIGSADDHDSPPSKIACQAECASLGERPKLRLWVMRGGTYICRVTILLRKKNVIDEFDFVWVQPGLTGMRDPEGKPKGQLPILELQRPSADGSVPGQYLFHSTGIINYIEMRWPDINPNHTPLQALEHKALVHDRMTFADEAILLASLYSYNASAFFHLRAQDPAMARGAWQRAHQIYATLEGMADSKGPYLVPGSGDRPTMVDYLLVGHPRLQQMYEAFEKRPSAVHNELGSAGWHERTRTMNPKGSDIPWEKFEIPVETEDKPHSEAHFLKAPF